MKSAAAVSWEYVLKFRCPISLASFSTSARSSTSSLSCSAERGAGWPRKLLPGIRIMVQYAKAIAATKATRRIASRRRIGRRARTPAEWSRLLATLMHTTELPINQILGIHLARGDDAHLLELKESIQLLNHVGTV